MLLCFKLIFLFLVIVSSDAADFDEAIIHDVNNEPIKSGEPKLLKAIFPGTLWCGPGNISTHIDELGWFKHTDRCCRTHDLCDDVIEAGETRHNLTNPSWYTRLNCKCDLEFYDCLKAVDSIPSMKVCFIYFNLLGTQCYRLDYSTTDCKEKAYIPSPRCLTYSYDTSKEKLYQWFDVPFV